MKTALSRTQVWTCFIALAIITVMAVISLRVTEPPLYAQFTPAYDLTGVWTGKDPGPSVYYQNGTEFRGTYINRGFGHFMTGKYVNPTTIAVTIYRRNRSSGCVTVLAGTYTATSADSIHTELAGRDANCDLPAGWKGSGDVTRDQALSNIWY